MAETMVVQVVLRVEEALRTDRETDGAVTDARRHLRCGRVDMSLRGHGPQRVFIVVEQREPGDVRADEASRPADDGLQKVLQRERFGEIVRRIDQEIEAAFADAAVADGLGQCAQMKVQALDVRPGRRRRRDIPHQFHHFGDVGVGGAEHSLFQRGRND